MKAIITLVLLLVFSSNVFSQEENKITLQAGMKYLDWNKNQDSVICRIFLEAPKKYEVNNNPTIFLFLMDYWATREIGRMTGDASFSGGVIDLIDENDYFGAVSFAKSGKVIFPLSQISSSNRNSAKSSLRNAKTVEGSDLTVGLQKIEEQLQQIGDIDNKGKHVFIILDKYLNNKFKDSHFSKIKRISSEYNVSFSTFSHYLLFDEDFLINISNETDGRAFYVEKNKFKDLENQINKEIIRVKKSSAFNIEIDFESPEKVEILKTFGFNIEDNLLQIRRIGINEKLNFYTYLKNPPSKRRDIIINLSYTDAAEVSDYNEVIYLNLPVTEKEKTLNQNHSSEILVYETYVVLRNLADKIAEGKKEYRQSVSDTLDSRIAVLKEFQNSLDSELLNKYIDRLSLFRDEIRNFAVENEVIIKKIKYGMLEFIYGI